VGSQRGTRVGRSLGGLFRAITGACRRGSTLLGDVLRAVEVPVV
jgi:hypothetical protein